MRIKLDENGVADYRALNYVQPIEKTRSSVILPCRSPGRPGCG